MSEWRPIETTPKDGSVILVAHNRGSWSYSKDMNRIRCVVAYWSGKRFDMFGPDCFDEDSLDWWMPFQEPPR